MNSRRRSSIAQRRAELVVQLATELLGSNGSRPGDPLQLQLTVKEFEQILRDRFASTHPELVMRSDSAIERARLNRKGLDGLPQVLLRMGAPQGRRTRGKPGR